MNRGRAYTRYARRKAIKRKKRIAETVPHLKGWYKHDGQYAKGKIHCSCLMCNCYRVTHELIHSDAVKVEKSKYSIFTET